MQKRTWGSWWTPSWTWLNNVTLLLRRLIVFLAALCKVSPASQERLSFLSTQHWWGNTWRPFLGSAVWERHGHPGSPTKMIKELEHSPMRRSWKSWRCSAWRRGCLEGYLYKYLKRRCSEDGAMVFSVVPNDGTRDKLAQNRTQDVPSKHQEALFYFVDDWALAQATQGGARIYSLEIFTSNLDILLGNLHQVD